MNSDDVKRYTKSISVLYVDNREEITDEIKELLGDFFAKVAIFTNSKDGLEAYKVGKFDIILLGLDITTISALEFIKHAKILHSYQHIVVTSKNAEINMILALLNIGVDKFIPKPFSKKKVLSVLYNISKNILDSNEKYDETKDSVKNAKTYKKIVDVVDTGIIVVDNYSIKDANKFAQKTLAVDSIFGLESFFHNLKDKTIKADGYIYTESIIELIGLTKDSGNFHRLLVKQELENRVLMFSINTIDVEKYVISFSDVTALDNIDRFNQLTKLPNSTDLAQKIDKFKDNTFAMVLITIKNYDTIIKWHGKTAGFETEKKVANFLTSIQQTFEGSYINNPNKNQYTYVIKKDDVKKFTKGLSLLADEMSIKVDSNSEKKEINFVPVFKVIEFSDMDINDLLTKLENEFMMMI
jgi:CheY-like chemotaxis protein